jgi:hypothetical protein
MHRDRTNALIVVLTVFFLMLNVFAPTTMATPFLAGIVLSEIAIIALLSTTLKVSAISRLTYGVFACYAATCCFVIGCKYYFERLGLRLSSEYILYSHAVTLTGFMALFLLYTLRPHSITLVIEKPEANSRKELESCNPQFSLKSILIWVAATAILIVLFKASWPEITVAPDPTTVRNGTILFAQKLIPFLLLTPLVTTIVLSPSRRQQVICVMSLLVFVPASIAIQSVMYGWTLQRFAVMGHPFVFASFAQTLQIDLGYFVSLIVVCLIIRKANRQADKQI